MFFLFRGETITIISKLFKKYAAFQSRVFFKCYKRGTDTFLYIHTDSRHVTVIAAVSSQYSSKVLLNTCLSINGHLFETHTTLHLTIFFKHFFKFCAYT